MYLQGKKQIIQVASVAFLSALLMSCAVADSSSSADCVLNNVGSAQTDAAVLAIQHACHAKFPPSQTEIQAAMVSRASREQAQREAEASANAAADAAAAAAASAADSNSL